MILVRFLDKVAKFIHDDQFFVGSHVVVISIIDNDSLALWQDLLEIDLISHIIRDTRNLKLNIQIRRNYVWPYQYHTGRVCGYTW